MLNQVIMESAVIKNEGLKFTQNGKAFLSLVLVFKTLEKSDKGWGEKKNYIRGTLWGKMAQNCSSLIKTGQTIIIRGKLRQNNWQMNNGIMVQGYSLGIDEIHLTRRKDKIGGE